MKLSTKLSLGLLALMLFNSAYAQKVLKPFPKNIWHVERTSSTFSKSINYLPTGGAVVAADFNKGECGAARLDEKGKTLWEYKTKGEVEGISRMNNNAILFYANNETGKGAFSMKNTAISSTVRAAIINIENGKLVKDIMLYDNGERVIISSKPLNKPDGSFSSYFVRVTNNDGYAMGNKNSTEKTLTSAKILTIGIDDNFTPKPTEIKSPGLKGFFAGAELGANDDLYFSYILDEQLITERINSSGKSVSKLSAPFAMRTNREMTKFTTVDSKNPTSFFIVLDYTSKDKDQVHQAFEFNFAQNKVSGSGEQAMDKAYLKSFEVSEIKDIRNAYKNDAENFALLNFLVADDRIVIVKGYQYFLFNSNTKSTHYQSGTVAIEVYDGKWNKLKTLALDRRFELFEGECMSVGATINNGKLYTVLPAFSGLSRLETLFAQIDLINLKVDKFLVLDNPYINRSARGPVVESDASIWLKDGVLMENCGDESGLFSSKSNVSSFWQKIEY